MDAIVFFVVAITISSILLYYARPGTNDTTSTNPDGQTDPESVLRVFLQASLGEEMVLSLDREIHISPSTEIAECLLIELEALALGCDIDCFAPMNEKLCSILETICSPVMQPYLLSMELLDEENLQMFSLPCDPPQSGTRYASSVELPGPDGSLFLLTLVLVPASLSEIRDVGACDLDLRLGIDQPSADLQP